MKFFYISLEQFYDRIMLDLSDNIKVSFEFFPPNTVEMEKVFWVSIEKLSKLAPSFISITHGISSGTHEYLFNIVKEVQRRTELIVAPHLICGNMTLQELKIIAKKYWDNNIRHVVALRGDRLNKCGHISIYAVDLVLLLKEIGNFDISVASYPEVHPEAISAQSDLINLKKKIDAGANRAITQFFFSVEKYLRFRDLCVSSNINIPIIPGIFPVYNFRRLQYFISLTRVSLPQWMLRLFNSLDYDLETQKMIGIIVAMDMIKILISEGVMNFHFYTLNRFELTYAICSMLGLKNKED